MKHLRLFVAAIAAVFCLGVNAQTWSNSDLAAGKYIFQNIGSGRYLGPANSWGTQASLIANSHFNTLAAIGEGKYTIESQVSNGDPSYYFTGTYMDGAAVEVLIQDDGNGVFTISNGTTYYGYDGSSYVLANNLTDQTSANAQWKIVAYDEALEGASEANPVDATFLIGCANFDRNHRNAGAWTMVASNQNLSGGTNDNRCAESWRAAFTLSQEISVPNGKYQVSAQAALTDYAGNTTDTNWPVVYANEETLPFNLMTEGESSMNTMSAQFSAGKYKVGPINVVVTDGKITIGVKGTRTDTWAIWDNFTMTYLGEVTDLSEFANLLAQAVAEAEALEGTIPEGAYQALAAVVAANNNEYTTADDYVAAIEAVKAATNDAKNLQAPYSRYHEVKAACVAVNGDLDTTEADAEANAATTVDEIEAAVASVRAALLAVIPEMEIEEGGYIDLTNAIIDNPTVSANVDYWNVDNVGRPKDWSTGPTTNYGETEFYQSTFDFNQNITGLPTGTYEFGVSGFHRAGTYQTYFYAGEDKILLPGESNEVVNSMADAKTYFDNGNGLVALKFVLEGESNDIKIGIVNNDDENTDRWTIFRNFTLKYFGTQIDLTEYQNRWAEAVAAAEAALADAANTNVTGDELAAILAAKEDTPEQTKASYLEKTDALIAATQAFIAAAPSYDAYYAEKVIAEMIGVEVGEDPTTAEAAAAGVNNLKVAEFNYVETEYPNDYAPVIGTFGEWTGTATVAGEPAEPNYLDYEHWSGTTHAYYEQAANGWGNAAGWTIKYEKTAKLPAGDYMLKVAARSSAGTTSLVSCTATENTVTLPNNGAATKGINLDGETSFEGDNFANNGNGFGWEWRYLPFTLTETTEVTMTFYAEATSQYQWMSIADGTLLSKQEIQNIVEIAGTDEAAPEAQVASQVLTDRKLLAGLNTVIFPFETTKEELGAATVLEYTGTTEEADGLTLNFKEVAAVDGVVTLQANVPYAVFADADQEENLTFGAKNINPGGGWYNECVTEDPNGQFDFRGTYTEWKKNDNSAIVAGDYVAGAQAFKKAKGGNGLKAYRAYLQNVSGTEAKVAFNFGGTIVDGIEAVELLNNLSGDIYNLNGQKLEKAQKGINIVNGKKVMVK